ncbi:MAG: periplasmic sensor signal transduction histidine kinase [Myxococcaceae bacterium]|nr:periplasmic sensor signal transduction histidine kinase [Myxococcaceae bacterium]
MTLFGQFRWRVFAHGLAVVLLMSVGLLVADRLFVNAWIRREVAERRVHMTNQVSVYGADGALLASNVEPPVPAPSPEAWAVVASNRGATIARDDIVMSGLLREGTFNGVVVRRLPPSLERYPGPPLPVVLLAFGACIMMALLVSVPLARSVVQPVEALSRWVKLFGSGKLSVRAPVKRLDEIGDLAAAFNEMAARIELHVRSEKQLLANVSHELRTPLARIRVVLDLASDGDGDAVQVQRYLSEIAHDMAELDTLLADILASARLDVSSGHLGDGALPLRWATADVRALVEKSQARFASLYPDRRLDVVADPDVVELRCDPGLLRRVVDNLLDNAAKYGEGTPIALTVEGDDDVVAIRVADEGPGMSPENAARAFEAFYRADESRDRRTGGVGLGLSIVRNIVLAHGGKVDLDTAPGRGTSVTVRIPRNAAT